jgi:hypothetical protein
MPWEAMYEFGSDRPVGWFNPETGEFRPTDPEAPDVPAARTPEEIEKWLKQ